ncbi:hypothetical protein [Streptomyces bluensis]|uniref:hypothetical protein n=1 Tax=Streptomyces bluensis TaxID=33897 RepID=UPI001677DFBA|nr:hypothetical protein [Streptomyces bluensis]GGZ79955.1 hypothetical protein GCM10010344_53840 [Streptomyces bluensis]
MSDTVATELVRSRRLLIGYFAGLGALMAVWGARMPAVQKSAGLSTAELPLVLLAAALGMVAVHLHSLDATTATSAAAFALYSAVMAAGRLVGDRLTTRYGAPALVRTGAALAALGLATGLASSTIAFALAGWTAFGLGLSVTIPSLITAAGAGGPRAVATVAVTGYVGLLAGPALIGALATTTLSMALLPALLAAAVAALSRKAVETPAP